MTIKVRPGDSSQRMLASLSLYVLECEHVGEDAIVQEASNAVAVTEHFGHLETGDPISEEPVPHAYLRSHAQNRNPIAVLDGHRGDIPGLVLIHTVTFRPSRAFDHRDTDSRAVPTDASVVELSSPVTTPVAPIWARAVAQNSDQ